MCMAWQAVEQAHKHGVVIVDFHLENFKLQHPLALSPPVFVAIDVDHASINASPETIAADKREYDTFFNHLVGIL